MTRLHADLRKLALVCLALTAVSGDIGSARAQQTQGTAPAGKTVPSPLRSDNSGFPTATIDAKTRWAFRTLSPVTVHSPIVRLGDVVKPLDANMAGWQRLQRSPIGLLPLGSKPMTIQRARLERAILDAEATPLAIDWVGPREIHVSYESKIDDASPDRPAPSTSSPQVRPVAYQESSSPPAADSVSEAEFQRIERWFLLTLERLHPEIRQSYQVEVVRNQAGLSSMAKIVGVTDTSPLDPVDEGSCRFRVTARLTQGAVDGELLVRLTPHPEVVVARNVLTRGHRVMLEDLEMQPIPQDQLDPDHVRDPAEIVGMEVRSGVRPGRPLIRSDLITPTLIRRGDLIEVRVIGGGVTVTTNGKAQGDGGASDLIEVETFEPRRRLLARVVQPGLVEIVTRAPRVQR